MKATAQHQLFELTRIDWATPQELFDAYDAEFGFVLDVCASADNAKCERYFTIEQDGLRQVWAPGPCWMNPPYGREIGRWTAKARRAGEAGITVVGLVPARTDTAWWHDDVMGQRGVLPSWPGSVQRRRTRTVPVSNRCVGWANNRRGEVMGGPWREVDWDEGTIAIGVEDEPIPFAYLDPDREDEARLIAAAPDLLDAVGGLLWVFNNLHNAGTHEFTELANAAERDARTAIAKATGTTGGTE